MPPAALMEGLSPVAARPLSFLRNGGATGGSVPTPASVPPTPGVMDELPPSAARPLAFLRNGGGAAPAMDGPPAPGIVMDDLPPSAARPLSFLRNGGAQPVSPPASVEPTPSPGPTVRITNMRRPEPEGPPEPQPYDDEADERLFPEEGSAEGCASGECIPAEEPGASTLAPAEPVQSASAPTPVPAAFTPRPPEVTPPSVARTPPPAFTPPAPVRAPTPAFAPPPAALEPEPPEPEPPPASAPVASGRDNPNRSLPERWRAAVDSVKATSVRHGTALANGRLVSMKAGEIVLGFPPSAAFHKAAVTAAAGKSTVDAALASHFGRPVKLTIQDVAQAQESQSLGMSISEQDSHSRATHEKSTEGKVRSHASVRAILKMLGGEIEHIQVYEPERPPAVLTDMPTTPDD